MMSLIHNNKVVNNLGNGKNTTGYLLNQIQKLLEKYFSASKNLDISTQNRNLVPHITEYKNYKAIHESFQLEFLKIDRSKDVGTVVLNLDLKLNGTTKYSFYICWVEDVFEKGTILKEKYLWSSVGTHACFEFSDKYQLEITEELNGYSCSSFSVFKTVFERVLKHHSQDK